MRVLGQHVYDLDLWGQCQIMYCLIIAYSPKPFDVATLNFAGAYVI